MEEEREDRSGTVNVFIKKSSLSNRKTKLDDFFGNEANRLIDEPNISHFLPEEGRDSCFHSLPLFPQRVNSNGKRIKLFPSPTSRYSSQEPSAKPAGRRFPFCEKIRPPFNASTAARDLLDILINASRSINPSPFVSSLCECNEWL